MQSQVPATNEQTNKRECQEISNTCKLNIIPLNNHWVKEKNERISYFLNKKNKDINYGNQWDSRNTTTKGEAMAVQTYIMNEEKV